MIISCISGLVGVITVAWYGFADQPQREFGEDSEEVIVDWVIERFDPAASPRVLDLGTGNGHLLHVLAEAGFATSQMVGIDYSPAAIELAEAIAKRRDVEDITFETVDIFSGDLARLGSFDLVLDKVLWTSSKS